MNAAVDELLEGPAAPPTLVPAAVMIDEPSIARAMHDAQRANRPVLEVLAETCGLAGDRYAQALASAFDYRFVSSGELAHFEPDFSCCLPPMPPAATASWCTRASGCWRSLPIRSIRACAAGWSCVSVRHRMGARGP